MTGEFYTSYKSEVFNHFSKTEIIKINDNEKTMEMTTEVKIENHNELRPN